MDLNRQVLANFNSAFSTEKSLETGLFGITKGQIRLVCLLYIIKTYVHVELNVYAGDGFQRH